MPADAAKCFDWKRIASCADIYRIDFREITEGTSTRTPAPTASNNSADCSCGKSWQAGSTRPKPSAT